MHDARYPNQDPDSAARVRAINQTAARRRAAMERRWHTIYKLYNAKGALLYVGISANRLARCAEHRNRRWWRNVTRIDLEHVKGRIEAERRELELIRTENPRHNVAGKPVASQPVTLSMSDVWTEEQKVSRILRRLATSRATAASVAEGLDLRGDDAERLILVLEEAGRVRPYGSRGVWMWVQ